MKTIQFVYVFCVVVVLLASSKNEASHVSPTLRIDVIKAQINGQPFIADKFTATYTKSSRTLSLVGFDAEHSVGFTLKRVTRAGTFSLGKDVKLMNTGICTEEKANILYATQNGRTGTVTLTKFDGINLEGTFSMKTYNSQQNREMVVTNGAFIMTVENL